MAGRVRIPKPQQNMRKYNAKVEKNNMHLEDSSNEYQIANTRTKIQVNTLVFYFNQLQIQWLPVWHYGYGQNNGVKFHTKNWVFKQQVIVLTRGQLKFCIICNYENRDVFQDFSCEKWHFSGFFVMNTSAFRDDLITFEEKISVEVFKFISIQKSFEESKGGPLVFWP